jgi:hypothetical protein
MSAAERAAQRERDEQEWLDRTLAAAPPLSRRQIDQLSRLLTVEVDR